MSEGEDRYDVVVVGGGPAGAATALHFHSLGYRVAVLDRESFDQPSHGWYVGVPVWMLEQSGLSISSMKEPGAAGAYVLRGPSGAKNIRTVRNPVGEVHLGVLVAWLRQKLSEAGVDCFDQVQVDGFQFQDERPVVLYAHRLNEPNSVLSLSASLFVDASGLSAVVRRRIPALARRCRVAATRDLCSAFQEVRRVLNPEAAEAFFRARGVSPGEYFAWTGLAGGYSTLTLRLSKDKKRIWLLAGAALDEEGIPGREILVRFRREQDWIGERISGGGGLIPIRRPYGLLVSEGVALVGNAGSQIFSMHASGVGASLMAARLLAESVSGRSVPGPGPGFREASNVSKRFAVVDGLTGLVGRLVQGLGRASRHGISGSNQGDGDLGALHVLWRYQRTYQVTLGRQQAVSDLIRRFFQGLDAPTHDLLVDAGLPTPRSLEAALEQRLDVPGLGDAAGLARIGLKSPDLLARMGLTAARAAALSAAYLLHPTQVSLDAQERWERAVTRLLEGSEPGGQ